MRTIAIASGKGGAGKTSLSAALARTLGKSAIACDCDVDAANTAIALGTKVSSSVEYWSGNAYSIQTELCVSCGECKKVCKFNAITRNSQAFSIDEFSCERCGACLDVCKANAIECKPKKGGTLFVSKSIDEAILVHAELYPGEDTSGKLVRAVRDRAEKEVNHEIKYILIDSPPGIGCPVIASLSGVDLVVVVIEAGSSGIRDARRLFELLSKMKIKSVSVINKTGISRSMDTSAKSLALEFNSLIVGELPYDARFRESTELGEAWVDAKDYEIKRLSMLVCNKIIEEAQVIEGRKGVI